ncbi:hypothetical protein F5Y05DRAFT_380257 [Hypoxylon sp. FL0543]|nr:hypothetical protein F5Y05DRAFT_380257 [Hypoxylon sp. FL0543]
MTNMTREQYSATADDNLQVTPGRSEPNYENPGPQEPHMHKVVFTIGTTNVYSMGDEPPFAYAGTHAKTTIWGPQWMSNPPILPNFRTVLDITTVREDGPAPEVEPPCTYTPVNTEWILFPDQRIAYIPLWKEFRILTYPMDTLDFRDYSCWGVIAPRWTGTWVVCRDGMYWVPPEPETDHRAYMIEKSRVGSTFLDREGHELPHFDRKSGEKYPNCVMLFSPRARDMYIYNVYGRRGGIRFPDARFVIMIRGSVQPLNYPPFKQWNLLREARETLDYAKVKNEHFDNRHAVRLSTGIVNLAATIGRMTLGS